MVFGWLKSANGLKPAKTTKLDTTGAARSSLSAAAGYSLDDKTRGLELFFGTVKGRPPTDKGAALTPEQRDFLRPRVPVGDLEFLQRNGWASYNSRRFQFVDRLPF